METRSGVETGRRNSIVPRGNRAQREAKRREDSNRRRRQKRASSREYRDYVNLQQRERYQDHKPAKRVTKLSRGLLSEAIEREVQADDLDPTIVGVFTMRETGIALGKTLLTIRSWVEHGLIPAPYLKDTTYQYDQYSEGELEVIADILNEHFMNFEFLQKTHVITVDRIALAVDRYRSEYI